MLIKNILVVRNDRFGEFLLNIPVLRALKESFIGSRVTLVVNASVKEFAEKIQYVDDLIVWESKKHTLKEILGISKVLKRKNFDACLILNPSKEFNLISFLAAIPIRAGYDRKWGFLLTKKIKDTKHLANRHEVDCNLELAGLINAKTIDKSLSVKLEEKTFPELAGDNNIAIHPFTSDPVKQWPIERFQQLVQKISSELGLRILIVGKEEGQGAKKFDNLGKSVVNMINKTSLVELAQAIKQCKLLVSCDSGPVHLAASIGVPVVALFRNDLPGKIAKRWGPWGKGHVVIERGSLGEITVDEVFNQIKSKLR